ncbi:MAG TPA: hemolysin III family protein [Herpetosiphonaceae bacterium]|nr:hemolysin III family protein [Herpetosiphonaceae bacterium]
MIERERRAIQQRKEASRDYTSPPKPLLRGWFHTGATVAALAITAGLLLRTTGDLPRFASVLIFGLSMIVLYGISSIYHIGRWTGRRRQVLRALDHANIFLLIAGTYTPICVNILTGTFRTALLALIWGLAAVGIGATVLMPGMPRWIATALYIGMGWLALVPLPAVVRALPLPATAILFAGGVLYTVGGLVYALRRPDPIPHVFGFHEVFHLFVIAGSAAFTLVIWGWVVPFSHG